MHYVVDICNDDLFILDPADDSYRDDTSTPSVPPYVGSSPTADICQEDISLADEGDLVSDNNNTIILFKPSLKDDNEIPSTTDLVSSEESAPLDGSPITGKSSSQASISLVGKYERLVGDEKATEAKGVREEENNSVAQQRDRGNRNVSNNGGSQSDQERLSRGGHNGSERRRRITSTDSDSPNLDKIDLELNSMEVLEASKKGDLQRIKELHDSGFSLLAVDEKGLSAMHHAANAGHENVVQYLATHEPSLMDLRENVEGQTPLHKAAKHRKQKVCCILAAAGCSVSKVDYQGLSAKQLAKMEGDEELAAYLERKL